MLPVPPQASEPPLSSKEALVAPRVRPETHHTGPAVCITSKKRRILLIAASEEVRDALLSALRVRVAPWPALRELMEAEMRAARAPSATAPSLADAAHQFVSRAAGAVDGSPGSALDGREEGTAGMAKVVWEKASKVAEMSIWTATFGQGLGGVARAAEDLERLTKRLGGLTVVGCAFSLVALSARAVGLMGLEREGRERLEQSRGDLRDASVSLMGWLFSILGSGFRDEDGLVGKVFDVLGECCDGNDELEQYLLGSWASRAWNAEDVSVIVANVNCMKGKLLSAGLLNVVAKHERRIGVLEDTAFVAGEFRPYAPDPFAFGFGLVENAATSLAQLKTAVFSFYFTEKSASEGHSSVLLSDSSVRRVALVSVNGEGGVGKTSTCRLLCADVGVRRRFSGGAIVWIDIGHGAAEDTVKDELGNAVLLCGGERTSESVRSSRTVKAAVEIARKFFLKRLILVVIDNVWDTPAGCRVASWAASLSSIASFPGSAVIMTTRSTVISKTAGFDRVPLGRLDLTTQDSPDWLVAEKLFDTLLDPPPEMLLSHSYKRNRAKALKSSCGLPLGIKTFVGVVRNYMENATGESVGFALSSIESRTIGLADEFVGEDLKDTIGHPGLFAAMEQSLSFLDKKKGRRVVPMPLAERKGVDGKTVRLFNASYDAFGGHPFSSRYAALEAMRSPLTRLSFPLLCRLWHLNSIEDVGKIVQLFANIGLGRIELGEENAFVLHDLQFEFCANVCVRSTGGAMIGERLEIPDVVNGHALFLASCESLLCPSISSDDGGAAWVLFCLEEGDGLFRSRLARYLASNLFRHMCAAAVVVDADCLRRTILSILSDFRWLHGRSAEYGRSSAVSDCNLALSSLDSDSWSVQPLLFTGAAEKSVRALQEGLILVGEVLSKESDGALAGSLVQLSQSFPASGDAGVDAAFFLKLTCSVEEHVRGSWVKAIRGCSRARRNGVLVEAVVGSGSVVGSLAALGDGAHFVSGSGDGVVRIHEKEYLGAVHVLEGHTAQVNCVAVAKKVGVESSFLLFSGSGDGTVRFWDFDLDPVEGIVEKSSVVIDDCGSRVWCLSVLNGGFIVASGCENGLVFIWECHDKDDVLLYELVTSFRCAAAETEMAWVRGVVVSGSGDFVVAGAENGGVAFWSGAGSEKEGSIARYCNPDGSCTCLRHVLSSEDSSDESSVSACLRHVLLSEDESSVCFVFDSTTSRRSRYEVWDLSSRRMQTERWLSGFGSGFDFFTGSGKRELATLTCATLSSGKDRRVRARTDGSQLRHVQKLIVGGWTGEIINFLSLYSTHDDFKEVHRFHLASAPRSVCYTSFGAEKKILVGFEDGFVRMLDASLVSATSNGAGWFDNYQWVVDASNHHTPYAPELQGVNSVAVMPIAGFVVAGHYNGYLSLWRAESGDFVRAFMDERWPADRTMNNVMCIDISADECLAVSGYEAGVALVWDATTWTCCFALVPSVLPEGHSKSSVVCAVISTGKKRIVIADYDGEIRFWDAENGGAALWTIKTALELSSITGRLRGAISLDGGYFLWIVRNLGDGNWLGKLIDLGSARITFESEESRHSDWDKLVEKMSSHAGFIVKDKIRWRFGAVYGNQFVGLQPFDSDQSSDMWRIYSGDEWIDFAPRVDCALWSSGGPASPAVVSLGFDSEVYSIAANWIPGEVNGRRRAVVVCNLRCGSGPPAIMHFCPARD